MTKKKILVTGSAGFIGFHLTKALLERGDEVVGLDNINDYYDTNLKYSRLSELGIEKQSIVPKELTQSIAYSAHRFIMMNLEDDKEIHDLFITEHFDVVVNLAAQAGVRYSLLQPKTYIKSNIEGFLNILEGCRHGNVKNLVYASSSSVYGSNTQTPFSTEHNVDHPISLYAASKKSNELMAHTYSHLFNIPTTGLRFFTVYGPWGRPDMALFLFTDAIIKGNPINVFNNGQMARDFTYVGDIVKGLVSVIDTPAKPMNQKQSSDNSSSAPYKIYNIGNSSPVNLMDFVKAIETKLGIEAEKIFLPLQPGDVPLTYADVQDFVNDFQYRPNTSIEEGVNEFINWYLEYYK